MDKPIRYRMTEQAVDALASRLPAGRVAPFRSAGAQALTFADDAIGAIAQARDEVHPRLVPEKARAAVADARRKLGAFVNRHDGALAQAAERRAARQRVPAINESMHAEIRNDLRQMDAHERRLLIRNPDLRGVELQTVISALQDYPGSLNLVPLQDIHAAAFRWHAASDPDGIREVEAVEAYVSGISQIADSVSRLLDEIAATAGVEQAPAVQRA